MSHQFSQGNVNSLNRFLLQTACEPKREKRARGAGGEEERDMESGGRKRTKKREKERQRTTPANLGKSQTTLSNHESLRERVRERERVRDRERQ